MGKRYILFFIWISLISAGPCMADGSERNFDSTKIDGFHFFRAKGIVFDSSSNVALYNEVFGWLGTPYRWGGKTKSGADCSGFASAVYKNVYLFPVGGSAGDIYKMLTPVSKDSLKEGDLVFFKINQSAISHVGIYLSNNKFIHETSWGKGVMVNDLNENYYKTYYFSAARIPDLANKKEISVPSDNSSPKQ